MNNNIGTDEVEKYVSMVCKQNVKKIRNISMNRSAMRMKLEDAGYDEKMTRKQFNQKYKNNNIMTIRGSPADIEFKMLMKYELEKVR